MERDARIEGTVTTSDKEKEICSESGVLSNRFEGGCKHVSKDPPKRGNEKRRRANCRQKRDVTPEMTFIPKKPEIQSRSKNRMFNQDQCVSISRGESRPPTQHRSETYQLCVCVGVMGVSATDKRVV